jgi:hypothetical protein
VDVLAPDLLAEVFRVRARVSRDDAGGIDYILAVEPLGPQAKTEAKEGERP